jgi:hypothetical protein
MSRGIYAEGYWPSTYHEIPVVFGVMGNQQWLLDRLVDIVGLFEIVEVEPNSSNI